ncbi:hypothetical protein [Chondromyces apiculatus]|uniref:hypothetical protein n=1 Tax=Chondromyces apiculatus TaxID=51 RepID=UPI0005C79D9E|nr:hypothetical protein [Chondromyces apiculatus]
MLFAASCALLTVGFAAGLGIASLAGLQEGGPTVKGCPPGDLTASAAAPAVSMAASAATLSAASSGSGAPLGLPPPEASSSPSVAAGWGEPHTLSLASAPRDVVFTEDGARAVVLGDDGALTILAVDAPAQRQTVALQGHPRRLRLVGPHHLLALDAEGALPLVDLRTLGVTLLDAGGPVSEGVMLGQGRMLLVASAQARRIRRFIGTGDAGEASGWRAAGDLLLPRAPLRLGVLPGNPELVLVLAPGGSPADPGTLEILDPRIEPLGVSRLAFSLVLDPAALLLSSPGIPASPGAGPVSGSTESLVLDRGGAQLLRVTPATVAITPLGAAPRGGVVGAARLRGGHLVVLDAAGEALVLAEAGGASLARIPLGRAPAAAATTPEGEALFIVLAGGPDTSDAEIAILAGDPPALAARLRAGRAMGTTRVAAAAHRLAISSAAERSVTIIDRR